MQTAEFNARFAGLKVTQLDVSAFRAGGATYLLNHGYPIQTIQLMGRWDSDAFRRYIRTLPDVFLKHC